MRQPHRNLFFYYRGGSPRDADSPEFIDRQIEDNSTKALINVLEMCDRLNVLIPFLQRFTRIRNAGKHETIEFALQRVDIRQPSTKLRVALAISPKKGLSAKRHGDHEHGRPDAWIWNSPEFALLIENKITGQATKRQLQRHIRGALGWTYSNSIIESVTWSDIYKFFFELTKDKKLADSSRMLLRHFVEYLRMTNLGLSATLELEDFAFFATSVDERDVQQKAAIGRKLHQLAEQIAHSHQVRRIMKLYDGANLKKPLEFVQPGLFRHDSDAPWIMLGPEGRNDLCHLTVRIEESGVSIDCFAPHRSYTRGIVAAIESHPKDFIDTLRDIPINEQFCLRLREAYYADPSSSYKGRNISRWRDFREIHPREVTKENLDALLISPLKKRLDCRDFRPEFFLVRKFSIRDVVRKEDAAKRIAIAASKMVPFLQFALENAGA